MIYLEREKKKVGDLRSMQLKEFESVVVNLVEEGKKWSCGLVERERKKSKGMRYSDLNFFFSNSYFPHINSRDIHVMFMLALYLSWMGKNVKGQ